jgi:uncharacterized protein (AIM24 family)
MQVEILYRLSYSVARVVLEKNEKIQAESGAMVGMSPEIGMETQARGGFLKSISRSMFGGASFFMNTYTGNMDGDSILLPPPLQELVVELTGPGKLILQSRSQDSFLSWLIPRLPKQTTYVSSSNS